ncbi:hypothetical protein FPV67DRAFT_1473053 [Lyophyllum atratum]|nr:hypothetical protein FPV67DRAFT_1473053 [Lyophyllum atratum]
MGISSSKAKSKRRPHPLHAPKAYYPYDPTFPPHYWPPPPPPNYGYPHPHPGFIPAHGGPVIPPGYIMPQYALQMPQPQLQWPPEPTQDSRPKKRRKTRKRGPTATLTFSTARSGPVEASTQTAAVHQEDSDQPDIPSTAGSSAGAASRPQIYAPPQPAPHPDLGSSPNAPPATPSPSHSTHSRHASVQIQASPIQPPPSPLLPPTPAPPPPPPVQPQTRTRTPNPLPDPPRDIYASSPYKHLLAPKALPTLPAVAQTIIVKGPESKPLKKGLFSVLRRKKEVRKEAGEVRYVFVPQGSGHFGDHVSAPPTPAPDPAPSSPAPPPPSTPHSAVHSRRGSVTPHSAVHSQRGSASIHTAPDPDLPPIYFNQDTDYSPFLNHSPYNVSYERAEYPTATHLLEALKFMPLRPDIAETIRRCEDTADVYEVSAENAGCQSVGYGVAYLEMVSSVPFQACPCLESLSY